MPVNSTRLFRNIRPFTTLAILVLGAGFARAADTVLTCPKKTADTEFAMVIFDPVQLGIDRREDDAGNAYEMKYFVNIKAREFDDTKPNWQGPMVCAFDRSWQLDLPIPNIQFEFHDYPIPERFIIRDVPRHSHVEIVFRAEEQDDFEDDWADFDIYPDGFGAAVIEIYTNSGKARTMTGKRQNQFDINFGKVKRLVGDGRIAIGHDTFRARLDFALNIAKAVGQAVPKVPPNPGNHPVCRDYALKAVQQNQEALKLGCGFKPPVWSNDHQMHFDWCVKGNNQNLAANETKNRQNRLDDCKKAKAKTPPKTPPQPPANSNVPMCQLYANEAIKIAAKAAALNCGMTGPRWLQDYNAHFNWCLANPNPVFLLAEAAARDAAYKACGGN